MNSIGSFSLLLVVGRDGVGVSLVGGKKGKRSLPMSQGIKSHLFLDIYTSRVIIAKRLKALLKLKKNNQMQRKNWLKELTMWSPFDWLAIITVKLISAVNISRKHCLFLRFNKKSLFILTKPWIFCK